VKGEKEKSISPDSCISPSSAEYSLRRARRTRALANCVTNDEIKAELDALAQEYEDRAIRVLKRPVDPGAEQDGAARRWLSSMAATQIVHVCRKVRLAVTSFAMEVGGSWRPTSHRAGRQS
jgi:hypothetical protein